MIQEFKGLMEKGLQSLRVAIIIAGGGTDMTSVLESAQIGFIPEVSHWIVIGTRKEAKGLEVARTKFGCRTFVVNWADEKNLHEGIIRVLIEQGIDVVIMLGNHRYIYPLCLEGSDVTFWAASHPAPFQYEPDFVEIPNFNIHPALPKKHGGARMRDLNVHIHVLKEIYDEFMRHGYDPRKRYTTTIVVHRAHKERFTKMPEIVYGDKSFDVGDAVTTQTVAIPQEFMDDFRKNYQLVQDMLDRYADGAQVCYDDMLKRFARKLQQHVLRYEWRLLPSAMRSIAWETITERDQKYGQLLEKWTE
jgi:folate-dependent phosphoribosylglycinamide formyltransferase PurN